MGWDGPLTHRQFIVWHAWLNEQFNEPSRTDYYLMQLSCEVRRILNKHPNRVKTDQFKLKFKYKEGKATDIQTREQKIQSTKNLWISRMSAPVTVRENGKVVDTIIPPSLQRKQAELESRKRNGNATRDGRPSSRDNGESGQLPASPVRRKFKNRRDRGEGNSSNG